MIALPYLLTASLYLLLFYGCYGLLLRRTTFFGLNRAYLLASVSLSLVLPLLELPNETANVLPVGTITLPAFAVGNGTTAESQAWSLGQWAWLLYGIGVTGMLVRLALNLWSVFRLIGRGTVVRKPSYRLVLLPDDAIPSFSFGRYLVLNRTDALTEPDVLMRHEEAHIRQYHTTDVVFLEIVQAIFWFNPVLLLYKRALQEVHEFLADRAVAYITPQPDYARQLVAYALHVPAAALTTPFVSKSTLKQRIVMLHKPQTHRRALLGYALALPLAACLVMCTQSERDQPQSATAQATAQANAQKTVNIDGEIFTVVENQPEFPGGMKNLGAYMQKNLRYPAAAQKVNAQGRVFLSFIVTKTGEITDVKILKGLGYGTDEEAIRVVSQMPPWKPGSQNGRAVNVKYNLPINFQLDENVDKAKSSAFFPVPTDDATIRRVYKHYLVDGKEVTFDEFKKLSKADIVHASIADQTISLKTK